VEQAEPAVVQGLVAEEVVLEQAGLLLSARTEVRPVLAHLCGSAVAFPQEEHPVD